MRHGPGYLSAPMRVFVYPSLACVHLSVPTRLHVQNCLLLLAMCCPEALCAQGMPVFTTHHILRVPQHCQPTDHTLSLWCLVM